MNEVQLKEITTRAGQVKVAIFTFVGYDDPTVALDRAVATYVGHEGYNEFIDANMDNPWVRVIIKGINDLDAVRFDPNNHRL
jgi:hypothetical protein